MSECKNMADALSAFWLQAKSQWSDMCCERFESFIIEPIKKALETLADEEDAWLRSLY